MTGVERVLAIIEDDADLRWLLEEFARESGFQFHMYATYDEAFTGLLVHPVDAIVADGVGCGFVAPTESDRARIAQLAAQAPTILHTARDWAHAPGVSASLGVEAVVPKPTDLDVLLRALERIVGQSCSSRG